MTVEVATMSGSDAFDRTSYISRYHVGVVIILTFAEHSIFGYRLAVSQIGNEALHGFLRNEIDNEIELLEWSL